MEEKLTNKPQEVVFFKRMSPPEIVRLKTAINSALHDSEFMNDSKNQDLILSLFRIHDKMLNNVASRHDFHLIIFCKAHDDKHYEIKSLSVWLQEVSKYPDIKEDEFGVLRDKRRPYYPFDSMQYSFDFNIFSEFLIQCKCLPIADMEGSRSFTDPPARIGVCKKITIDQAIKACDVLEKWKEVHPDATSVIGSIENIKNLGYKECYFIVYLEQERGTVYRFSGFTVSVGEYKDIIAGRHYYPCFPPISMLGRSEAKIFEELGFVFNKRTNQFKEEYENRLQEQESFGREGNAERILHGKGNFPKCSIGHLRDRKGTCLEASGVRKPQAIISTRHKEVLRA